MRVRLTKCFLLVYIIYYIASGLNYNIKYTTFTAVPDLYIRSNTILFICIILQRVQSIHTYNLCFKSDFSLIYFFMYFVFRKGTLKLIHLIYLVSGVLFISCKTLAMVELFFIARLLSGLSAGEFHSLKTYPYL